MPDGRARRVELSNCRPEILVLQALGTSYLGDAKGPPNELEREHKMLAGVLLP